MGVWGGVLLTCSSAGCAGRMAETHRGTDPMAGETIEALPREQTDAWMSIPGIVGTGVGERDGMPWIKVFVAQKSEMLAKKIPVQVECFAAVLEETGEFRALGVDAE